MRVIITVLVQNLWLNRITFSYVRKQEYALPGVSKRSPRGSGPFATWPLATYRNATGDTFNEMDA